MPITEYVTGSETVDAEHSLVTDTAGPDVTTDDGIFQVFIDFVNLTVTEVYRIRVYERVSSGGTSRIVEEWVINGPVSNPIWVSPTLILLHGWDVTLTRIAGTNRSIEWSIRRVN